MNKENAIQTIQTIQTQGQLREAVCSCTGCPLHATRKHALFGEGAPDAPIFIIGEAPGADEDRIGRPFVGKSGQLLDRILEVCGFTRRQHVFLSNIVRCRPPQNRVPTRQEVEACIPFLFRQIELVDPKILIPLGATALKQLFGNESLRITRLRGNWMDKDGRLVMPVYHPAALLRNPGLKKETWEDFKKIIAKYRELIDSSHHSDYA